MNRIYEFTLHPSGYDPVLPRHYVIGAGTLKDGLELLDDMNHQFVEWANLFFADKEKREAAQIEPTTVQLFKLRIPSQSTPISLWEGADIFASGGPFGTQYGKELFEEYIYTAEEEFVDSYKWEPWND